MALNGSPRGPELGACNDRGAGAARPRERALADAQLAVDVAFQRRAGLVVLRHEVADLFHEDGRPRAHPRRSHGAGDLGDLALVLRGDRVDVDADRGAARGQGDAHAAEPTRERTRAVAPRADPTEQLDLGGAKRAPRIPPVPAVDHAVHLREAGEGEVDLVRDLAGLARKRRAGSGLVVDVVRATPEGSERIERGAPHFPPRHRGMVSTPASGGATPTVQRISFAVVKQQSQARASPLALQSPASRGAPPSLGADPLSAGGRGGRYCVGYPSHAPTHITTRDDTPAAATIALFIVGSSFVSVRVLRG